MADINQNFSIFVGDDLDVDYDLGPDDTGLDLSTAVMTWSAYPQIRGTFDKSGGPVLQKTNTAGITVDDPVALTFHVSLVPADTAALAGNYGYELKIVAAGGKQQTPTIGTMTVIDTGNPLNVVAFKSVFPELETVDDGALQTALDEAALFIDDTWLAQDVTAGSFYLAAHFVFTAQSVSQTGGQTISSEHIGEISVNYAVVSGSSSSRVTYPSLSNSNYGLMYLTLMRRNGAGIAIV